MRFRIIENPSIVDDEEGFVKDYYDGLTFNELGEKYGFSYGGVQKRVKRLGLTPRGKGNNNPNKRKIKKVKL